jgi:glycosyltransferase involved in cell wall biosynthesis
VKAIHEAGVHVTLFPGVLHRPLPNGIEIRPTLSISGIRVPYKLLGRAGACGIHDWVVARRLRQLARSIDLVHCFALGSSRTLRTARELGIPTVLERCNAHSRFAYEIVQKECDKLGFKMHDRDPHVFNASYLSHEESEYKEAFSILCPSDFVARTFLDQGFPLEKLEVFQYGYNESGCNPGQKLSRKDGGLTVLFAAGCGPRKGLHYALEAWLASSASLSGEFLIAGDFIPGYAKILSRYLSHPSVKRLGYRKDLNDVMGKSDILVLPSIEEGSALVTYDARACGCVLLVSESTGAICEHEVNALIHPTGDVSILTGHFNRLHHDRDLLESLRAASLATVHKLTWAEAGLGISDSYKRVIRRHRDGLAECQ